MCGLSSFQDISNNRQLLTLAIHGTEVPLYTKKKKKHPAQYIPLCGGKYDLRRIIKYDKEVGAEMIYPYLVYMQ